MSDRPAAFDEFHDGRAKTLSLVRDLTQAQLDFSPSSRKWSVGEVLDHLVRVDEVFRDEYDELRAAFERRGTGG